jgi:hypothetical protein
MNPVFFLYGTPCAKDGFNRSIPIRLGGQTRGYRYTHDPLTVPDGSTHEARPISLDVLNRFARQVIPNLRRLIRPKPDDSLVERHFV